MDASPGLNSEQEYHLIKNKPHMTGKIILTLLLSCIAALGVVLIIRVTTPKPIENVSESVIQITNKPTITETPRQFAYITNVESGALVFSESRRSSDYVTKIRKGERVEIVECLPDGEWCIVHYKNIYAYIQLKYLALE